MLARFEVCRAGPEIDPDAVCLSDCVPWFGRAVSHEVEDLEGDPHGSTPRVRIGGGEVTVQAVLDADLCRDEANGFLDDHRRVSMHSCLLYTSDAADEYR